VLVDDCGPPPAVAAIEARMAGLEGVRLVSLAADGDRSGDQAEARTAIGDCRHAPARSRSDRGSTLRRPGAGGFDVVVGIVRDDGGELSRGLSRAFYSLADRMLPTRILRGTTAFRVLSRQAVNALERVRTATASSRS
jgi:hypothetical protein